MNYAEVTLRIAMNDTRRKRRLALFAGLPATHHHTRRAIVQRERIDHVIDDVLFEIQRRNKR